MCLCLGGGAEQQQWISAFIRNLTQDNENKMFSVLDHFDDMRLSETDDHSGLFHFTEHILICGSRDEAVAAAAPDDYQLSSRLIYIL